MTTGSFMAGWDGGLTWGRSNILRLSLVSKYQTSSCGISLLTVPYVSFPLHCLPRVKSYSGPLYPWGCYGNPWEAPGLVPPSVFLNHPELPIITCWLASCLPGCGLGTSLIAQLVKNPPAIQETPVQFLGQEDLLGKGQATYSTILGLPLWLSW